MTGLSEFKVSLSPTGRTDVLIDDQDVSASVDGIAIQSKSGAFPVVTLYHAVGTAEIEGVGVVQVAAPDEDAVRLAVRRFLGHVDAGEIEARVLDNADFSSSPVADVLRVLMEMASD